ncbi:hypothetical protein ASPTUDRAFT_45700 [Aspergillus tubingensis CBS 134.48]|uniref:Secreted protein n=1 Tax=Aspergillus tubingensis (strain CBS 134.48) TaxID=767770 RepID=A0A1L9MZ24_ASPTC|nr:hypothetical protein ASPTUDRAFT_45700 [Aspergillus tubingensis CBS 134.48]
MLWTLVTAPLTMLHCSAAILCCLLSVSHSLRCRRFPCESLPRILVLPFRQDYLLDLISFPDHCTLLCLFLFF